ncbi:MAG: phosphatidylinositol-specific phospholipase C domain-containing protein [Methylobacter sp.]|uniref:1-phosphatidylinositol phosphodiesterase n=1 Tax=Candidatus Methylobacter titanis TaxID=3053457 RepID=A0AA43Q342_9GAMM|nr:phosphatidylinositol-specific phospholipase C domain-containing protein [Candidatus Methylobacter titanis]MDI1292182.1 phosphatidylinositol-specific phospholipase C domain-containing protein [Candidatus Methylobacter titanis]
MAGNNWMTLLRDNSFKYDKPITELVIPGTHDSGAYEYAYTPMVRAQNLNIRGQLDAGVRALDIRCGATFFSGYNVFHGPIDLGMTVDSVIADIRSFLDDNPGEFVILMLKQEVGFTDISNAVNKIVNDGLGNKLWQKDDNRTKWPTTEKCKGKAIVFSRFTIIDANHYSTAGWAGDFASKNLNVGGNLSVEIQDLYNSPSVVNKKAAILALHNKGKIDYTGTTLYLNFSSFVWKPYEPLTIGPSQMTPYLMRLNKGAGVICVDGADSQLLDQLISLNNFM